MLSQERIEQVILLCQELIRAKSLSGQESDAVKVLQTFMQNHGFKDIFIDQYGSITGCIKGNHPGPIILFDGHLDVVPVPDKEQWTHDPFAATRVDGKIYGRGTSDMKGAVAAMTAAAAFYAQDNQHKFSGEIHISAVVHEECFEGIAARKMSERIKPDVVIIGEPSALDLKIGQRGRAEIILETFGIPAHSANPHKGVNAVHLMCKLIEEIEKITPPEDEVLGKGVAVLTDMISSPYPGASVVPSHCKATYDRRLLVGETQEDVLQPFQNAINHLTQIIPNFKAKVSYAFGQEKCYTGAEISSARFFPGWCAKPDDEFVQKALHGLQNAGVDAKLAYYPFCTNGSHYAGEAKINTIGFGPSPETMAHTVDEHIEETQLIKATEGYIGICSAFLAPH